MGRYKTPKKIRKSAVMHLTWLSVAEVAAKFKVTPPTIRSWVREFDVPLPEPKRPQHGQGYRARVGSETRNQILVWLLADLLGRTQAAEVLDVSRQYVHRVWKRVQDKYFLSTQLGTDPQHRACVFELFQMIAEGFPAKGWLGIGEVPIIFTLIDSEPQSPLAPMA